MNQRPGAPLGESVLNLDDQEIISVHKVDWELAFVLESSTNSPRRSTERAAHSQEALIERVGRFLIGFPQPTTSFSQSSDNVGADG